MVIRTIYREEGKQNIKQIRQGARGIVIDRRDGCPHILLNYAEQEEMYDIPGGGVEEGESLEEGCIREVREETGYQVEILSKAVEVNEYHYGIQFVNTYFICRVVNQAETHLTKEEADRHLVSKWVPYEQAKQIFSEYERYKQTCRRIYEFYLREYTALSCVKETLLEARIGVRPMRKEDCETIVQTFLSQGWNPNPNVYETYFQEQKEGKREVFVAEVDGKMAGYITLVPRAKHGPFAGTYPELKDFNVFESFQKNGIGWMLMESAEKQAKKYGDVVTLGVGLHAGYGQAQRMYSRRGYLPDGSGVWYRNENLKPYAPCVNNDDLVLYLYKEIKYC